MTKPTKYRLYLLTAVCCILWGACTQQRQPCLTPKIASLNVECMHRTTDTSTVYIDTALPRTVVAAFTDSGAQYIIYRNQTAFFTLSLSSTSDSCKWGFTTDTTLSSGFDTLTFYYQRHLQFISNACGYAYFYSLSSVRVSPGSTPIIDGVLITNNDVTNNVNTRHVQIYIHPNF
jgi:hypothetical protein